MASASDEEQQDPRPIKQEPAAEEGSGGFLPDMSRSGNGQAPPDAADGNDHEMGDSSNSNSNNNNLDGGAAVESRASTASKSVASTTNDNTNNNGSNSSSSKKKKGTAAAVKGPSKRGRPGGGKKTKGGGGKKAKTDAAGKQPGVDGGNSSESDSGPYCLCRGPDDHRFMIACDRCEDWFHGECIGMDKHTGENLVQKYICPNCTDGGRYATRYKK
ncbi:hypothetical protein VTH06DRAFT_4474, partial [Thermothelomyces fergusii]